MPAFIFASPALPARSGCQRKANARKTEAMRVRSLAQSSGASSPHPRKSRQAGGLEEVTRIAKLGWPQEVIVRSVAAKRYEDDDDSLSAAALDVARELDLQAWEVSARWDDEDEREYIVVTSRDADLLTAIQERAESIVESATAQALESEDPCEDPS